VSKRIDKILDFSKSDICTKSYIGRLIDMCIYFYSVTKLKNLPSLIAVLYKDILLKKKNTDVKMSKNRKSFDTFSTKLSTIKALS
jgi:hypothetical protein